MSAYRKPGDRLFNVTARVVTLKWARTPEGADRLFRAELDDAGLEVMPDPSTAFVSEPVPTMGWEGEG